MSTPTSPALLALAANAGHKEGPRVEGKKGTHQQFLTSLTTMLYYHLSSEHLPSDRYVLMLKWRCVNSQTQELAVISGDSEEPSEASSIEGLKPGSVWSHLDRAGWGMSAAPAGPADPLAPSYRSVCYTRSIGGRWRPSWTTWPRSWHSSRPGRS